MNVRENDLSILEQNFLKNETSIELINGILSNVEKRLQSSETIYKLKIQAQNIREKENKNRIMNFQKQILDINEKLKMLEDVKNNEIDFFDEIIYDELEKYFDIDILNNIK